MKIPLQSARRLRLFATVALTMFLLDPGIVTSAHSTPYSSAILLCTSMLYGQGSMGFLFPTSMAFRRPERSFNDDSKSGTSICGSSLSWWSSPIRSQLASVRDEDQESIIQQNQAKDDQNNPYHNNPDIPQRRLIEVSSRIELPFSIYDAYDAYADLARQPVWSSWLESVVVSDTNPDESVWTMKFLGIRYSWTAVAVQNQRPHLIQWKSITGLKNFGTVRFYEQPSTTTLMTMSMTFVAPRAVSMVFSKSKTLANFVEQKMITESLQEFRRVVSSELVQTRQLNNLTGVSAAAAAEE
jgi:uncharacterized membrane protein